ncbi:uncharacterized protein LOC131246827 isoform X2 [Magnolia sinica]|uniref:uncharacterized protein LOC131246827 isoform X2 n=1 Tax=Magnolia sinica TaxID=86752 RepID=UPI00265A61F7|nr:uncharacterized protein LOC131246827 isoform X2 [Magnolia sinica]
MSVGGGHWKASIKEPEKKQNKAISTTPEDRNAAAGTLISTSNAALQDRTAPLVSALKASAQQNAAGFHFPGHNRGQAAPPLLAELIGIGAFAHDLPELPELDNLFSPNGVILDAQKLAAELFRSSETWFLVGGTTCGVQAAIMATCSPGETLILPRNSHISAISAMVLSGAVPKYIIPQYNPRWDIASGITSSQVERAIDELKSEGRVPTAVLVTSPTYNGICSNVSEIAQLCHSHSIPIIVDEAHGAHFRFHHQMPNTALDQGADIVIQSTHKVLCSLTQSSMLHISGDIVDRERIRQCLQTLQSTSPSYLLLASLDATRAHLSKDPDTIFDEPMELAAEAVRHIKTVPGISLMTLQDFPNFPAIDPLRITVGVWELGLSGYEADGILCKGPAVIAELAGGRSLTFAVSLGTCRQHIQRLVSGLDHLSATFLQKNGSGGRREGVKDSGCAPFADISMEMSPREAFFARKRSVKIEECIGEVCGEFICTYPPGIPVLIPGEIITERALSYLLDARNKGAEISGAADPQISTVVVCK